MPASQGGDTAADHPDFLSRQLITYLGNKRALLGHIERAVLEVRDRLGGRRIRTLDLFSGSGVVARLLKAHSQLVMANDLETYSRAANECFLADRDERMLARAATIVHRLNALADGGAEHPGFIRELYSPADDRDIRPGERAFYSNDNARRLDFFAQELATLPPPLRTLLLGPLLSAASIHANTSGVFKGFHKDKTTGLGRYGGTSEAALKRILDPIRLELPVLSAVGAPSRVFQEDANALLARLPELDLVYVDPPYNQHPYGSNYFMLNLVADYRRPRAISAISGIPLGWNRSGYNVRGRSLTLLIDLLERVPARFLLVSFNAEGHVRPAELRAAMEAHGRVDEIVVPHSVFRGSRNLRERAIRVDEHLLLLDRDG